MSNAMGDDMPDFPGGVWIAGIVGSLIGMALFGTVPKGYGHRGFSARRDDSGIYWLYWYRKYSFYARRPLIEDFLKTINNPWRTP